MLNTQRINQIEAITREIIGNYFGDISKIEPPINVARILEANNLNLAQATFDDPTISGAYNKANKTVYVNVNDSKTRQFFTVAHELGHFYLEPDKTEDIFYRSQLNDFRDTDGSEQEANWFATALLMPKEIVEKIWKQDKDEDLIAAYFGVSFSAAHWRLKNLRLI
jgi:Zn-dependent peptidase ImmA (M78 family)